MATAAPAYVAHPPLEGAARVWGTIALSAATFMNVLDSSIANVSLPAISGDLGVSTTQGTWVITSFAVANAIAVPLTGFMTQRFGQCRERCGRRERACEASVRDAGYRRAGGRAGPARLIVARFA